MAVEDLIVDFNRAATGLSVGHWGKPERASIFNPSSIHEAVELRRHICRFPAWDLAEFAPTSAARGIPKRFEARREYARRYICLACRCHIHRRGTGVGRAIHCAGRSSFAMGDGYVEGPKADHLSSDPRGGEDRP